MGAADRARQAHPSYIFIAGAIAGRPVRAPELPLDRLIPLEPAWALVYGALYAFLIVLPVFVVRQPEHIRRTVKVGLIAVLCASLVALSTLYSKQHYVLDVVAGVLLACVAYAVFLRDFHRERVPVHERRLAPVFAVGTISIVGLGVACFWVVYRLKGLS